MDATRRLKRRRPAAAQRGLSLVLLALATLIVAPLDAHAAERWIDRPMTLDPLVFAGNVGVGIGHIRVPRPAPLDDYSRTGAGMNLEAALGVTRRLELGLRTGVRFGADGQATQADSYGRTLWTETYGTGHDNVANPELRMRWIAYTGSVTEVGLDGRVFLPVEDNTNFGLMFGVPFAFHVVSFLRIDTGAYVPVVFNDPTFHGLSVPAYFWFQTSPKLWLGPMAQLRIIDPGPGDHDAHLLLGFGLGYQVASAVDLKTMILFRNADDNLTRHFGAGFGVEFRIGE